MTPLRFTLKKSERLRKKSLIDSIFSAGKPIGKSPVKCLYILTGANEKTHAQVMMVVPSKQFPRAVDRNKIKRQMRDSYRLEKNLLTGYLGRAEKKIACAFVFTGKEIARSETIHSTIRVILAQLISALESDQQSV